MNREIVFNKGGSFYYHANNNLLLVKRQHSKNRVKLNCHTNNLPALAKFLAENGAPTLRNLYAVTNITAAEHVKFLFKNDFHFANFCRGMGLKTLDDVYRWQFEQLGEDPKKPETISIKFVAISENQSPESYFIKLAEKLFFDDRIEKIIVVKHRERKKFELFR